MRTGHRLPEGERERVTRVQPERRARERGTPDTEPHRPQLVSMIVGTYREMPGLCLHLNQASRLFGFRQSTCQIVLEDLVRAGTLRRAADGQYSSQ
jgi:hypothetical protein